MREKSKKINHFCRTICDIEGACWIVKAQDVLKLSHFESSRILSENLNFSTQNLGLDFKYVVSLFYVVDVFSF